VERQLSDTSALAGLGATNARACSFNAVVISPEIPRACRSVGPNRGCGFNGCIPVLAGAPDGVGSALGVTINGSIIAGVSAAPPSPMDRPARLFLSPPLSVDGRWNKTSEPLPSTGTQFRSCWESSSGFIIVGNKPHGGTMGQRNDRSTSCGRRAGVSPDWRQGGISHLPHVVLRTATGISFRCQVIGEPPQNPSRAKYSRMPRQSPRICVGDHTHGLLEVQDIFDF